MIATRFLRRCLLAAAIYGSSATVAADATGTGEVDVVFPRNDTYKPMPLMPVVFAIQNPSVVSKVWPELVYAVYPLNKGNQSLDFIEIKLNELPTNESTHYVSRGVSQLLNDSGAWGLSWGFRHINCSKTDDPKWQSTPYNTDDEVSRGFHLGHFFPLQHLVFTTGPQGREPDLEAISGGDSCGDTQSFAFDVKENLDVPRLLDNVYTTCASLATAFPTAQPCRASVGSDKASSISAAITQAECSSATHPAISCPTDDESGASHHAEIRLPWLAFTVLGVVLAYL